MNLIRIWGRLSRLGVDEHLDDSRARYIIYTNRTAIIASVISLFFVFVFNISFGFLLTINRWVVMSSVVTFALIPVLNQFRVLYISRLLLCYLPTIYCFLLSLINKIVFSDYNPINDYFTFRFIILITAIFPLLIFSSRNLKMIGLGLVPSFIGIFFFDAIHDLFGVGFHQVGFRDDSYFMTTVVSGMAYLGLVGFIFAIRTLSDRFEQGVKQKNQQLNLQNTELKELSDQVIQQRDEIWAQSEQLKFSNEKLLKAYQIIEQQKDKLEYQIEQKTKNLVEAGRELSLQYNELREFSYLLAHNLKGPVASLMGLLNLIEYKNLNANNREIIQHFHNTVEQLNYTYRDLHDILSLRSDLYNINEPINLPDVIIDLKEVLKAEIEENKVGFQENYGAETQIISNRAKVNSILYHLINNAIKYHAEDRDPLIRFETREDGEFYILAIHDNGVGIDLKLYGEKLFQMYMQFHERVNGRGLGLYLVRTQAESLGGRVEVESEVNQFTRFTVYIKKPIVKE